MFLNFRYTITEDSESVQKKLIIDDICPESVHMRKLSTNANDLQIGVASFCKAFPWHFIMDRKLELVQLGKFLYNRFVYLLQKVYIFYFSQVLVLREFLEQMSFELVEEPKIIFVLFDLAD